MKSFLCILILIAIFAPCSALARGIVEHDVGPGGRKPVQMSKAEVETESAEVVVVDEQLETEGPPQPEGPATPSNVMIYDRWGRFRAGLIGPGFAAANKGPGAMMTMGLEGEYFIFERLSAGMQVSVATEFDDYAILDILPFARYTFDLHSHPRWSLYVQGGVGVALYNGKHAAADIAIPGGGFWYQWTDHLSVGADAWFHVFVRGQTAVGFALAPAVRYQF